MSIKKNSKLMDEVRRVMRLNHYSIHTEKTYSDWIWQYVKFHKMTDRADLAVMPESKVEEFLSYFCDTAQCCGLYPKPGDECSRFFI